MLTVWKDFTLIGFLVFCVQDPMYVTHSIKFMFTFPSFFVPKTHTIKIDRGYYYIMFVNVLTGSGTSSVRASISLNSIIREKETYLKFQQQIIT